MPVVALRPTDTFANAGLRGLGTASEPNVPNFVPSVPREMGGAIVVALSINADLTQACGVNERNNMPSDVSNSVSAIMTPPKAARYLGLAVSMLAKMRCWGGSPFSWEARVLATSGKTKVW